MEEKPTKLNVSFGRIWDGSEEGTPFNPKNPKYSEVEELYFEHSNRYPIKNLGYLSKLKSLTIRDGIPYLFTKRNSFFDKKIDLHKLKDLTLIYGIIPEKIKELDQLEELNICQPTMKSYARIPSGDWPALKSFGISHIEAEQLPINFGSQNLKKLSIQWIRNLESIPENIRKYMGLENLDFGLTKLRRLPYWIGELKNLRTLKLWNNAIEYIPNEIGQLKKLELLDLDHNGGDVERNEGFLRVLPSGIGELENLQYLFAYGNRELEHLPKSMSNLRNLKCYDFKDVPLSDYSKEVLSKITWAKPRQHKGAILSMLEKNKGDIGLTGGMYSPEENKNDSKE